MECGGETSPFFPRKDTYAASQDFSAIPGIAIMDFTASGGRDLHLKGNINMNRFPVNLSASGNETLGIQCAGAVAVPVVSCASVKYSGKYAN